MASDWSTAESMNHHEDLLNEGVEIGETKAQTATPARFRHCWPRQLLPIWLNCKPIREANERWPWRVIVCVLRDIRSLLWHPQRPLVLQLTVLQVVLAQVTGDGNGCHILDKTKPDRKDFAESASSRVCLIRSATIRFCMTMPTATFPCIINR